MREHYRSLLRDVARECQDQFVRNLETTRWLRSLLYESGVSDETIERFGVGYATKDWSSLANVFKERETYYLDAVRTLGLVQAGKRGSFDYFRERIVLPVTNDNDEPVGFTSRTVNSLREQYSEKKFDRTVLHSPHSPIFNKRNHLVGTPRARRSIRRQQRVLVTLDPLELLELHENGRDYAVMELLPGGFNQPGKNSQHRRLLDAVNDLTVLRTKKKRVET